MNTELTLSLLNILTGYTKESIQTMSSEDRTSMMNTELTLSLLVSLLDTLTEYIKENIQTISPEDRTLMRKMTKEMTDLLKDPERVKSGMMGCAVATRNGRKARRDIKELTDNEVVLNKELESLKGRLLVSENKVAHLNMDILGLEYDRNELRDNKVYLNAKISDLKGDIDELNDEIISLKLEESVSV